ncbi:MAG: TlpA family protein disulfide reductase [Thiohalomonadales bacterium]
MTHILRVLIIFSIFSTSVYAGTAAPNFNLAGDAGKVSLSEYKGQVIYLDFWASWCVPCRKSFPWMSKMQSKYGDLGFQVIAINLDKEKGLAHEFLKAVPSNFTIAYDPEGSTASLYKVKGMPSSYLVGRDGSIHYEHLGFRDGKIAEMEQQIKTLIKQ